MVLENNSKSRPVIVFLGALAVGIHLTLFALPENYTYVLLYIRCVLKKY